MLDNFADQLEVSPEARARGRENPQPSGHDIAEGIYNLPVLRALQSDVGDELAGLLGSPIEGAEREAARTLVLQSGGIEETMAEAERHARRAQDALAPLADSPAKAALHDGVDHVLGTVAASRA